MDIPHYLFEFPEFIYDLEILDSIKKKDIKDVQIKGFFGDKEIMKSILLNDDRQND